MLHCILRSSVIIIAFIEDAVTLTRNVYVLLYKYRVLTLTVA